jgi:integrase
VAADRARTSLSTLFAFAIDRNHIDFNPTINIKDRGSNGGRTRVLSEPELAEVWHECLDNDYGKLIRLLILTGQRRRELGDLIWSEVNELERQIELPEARVKNKRAHIVPLSDQAWEILHRVERIDQRDLVFGSGRGGFTGWSKSKDELDARIAAARRRKGVKNSMPSWVLHDLRRSMVTHMNERGFAQPHVIEAICNHVSGHKSGVAGIYNRAVYLQEKREALALWGRHVMTLVERQTK